MGISKIIIEALGETLYMVFVSTFFAVLIGFAPAIVMVLTDEKGLSPNKSIYKILDAIVNILRSFPFIILMIVIFPFTKIIVGTTIGTTAAIVPITIGAAPFVTRIIEGALKEVDKGVIEAAKSFGASNVQIIFKVMIIEALPTIISGLTLTIISVVGLSAMAGAIGGGGLGDVAIKYGYYRFKTDVMLYTVVVLIILVQIFQSIGNYIYNKANQ